MVHVSVQVVSSYVTPWLSNTCLISVISFVITLYKNIILPEIKFKGFTTKKDTAPVKKIHETNKIFHLSFEGVVLQFSQCRNIPEWTSINADLWSQMGFGPGENIPLIVETADPTSYQLL
jgi:hypothetical protein